jgi:hypothetical protein
MSAAAEEALAAAWAAHQASPEQLTQLAVDVCGQLGWANVQVGSKGGAKRDGESSRGVAVVMAA